MKEQNPFRKNEEITLEITGITSEGQGVGRSRDVAIFVPNTVACETVRAHIIKVEKRYCIAKAVSIETPSVHRVPPVCEAYAKCGGCALMHMDYEEQLRVKRQTVLDALERLGGFVGVEVQPVLGMRDPWRYRNKGSFPFGTVDGTVAFGFYAERSHRLIPLFDCPIEDERITAIARTVTEWAKRNHVRVYEETTGKGCLRACVVRIASTGARMVAVVTKGELPAEESLVRMIDAESLYHNRNDRNTNVLFGPSFRLLKGSPAITERQGDLQFLVSPQSFLQVNPTQTEVLYDTAIRLLDPKPDESVADVYCGIGTISLALARHAKSVIGIECVPEAIDDAKKNAALNGIENTLFLCGLAEDVLPSLVEKGMRPDAIVIDPPRKGCEEAVLNAIAESGVNRLVYVSCNPATLARDAKILSTYGFRIKHVQPVDMFPHTQHVETVVLLTKK
jgi:23S rRNA (uracil1939-C5)-methyltransferase